MGSAAGLALGSSFDWDKAFWVPGEKTIFLPPAPTLATTAELRALTGNKFLTLSQITKEALLVLENNLKLTQLIERRYEDGLMLLGKPMSVPLTLPEREATRQFAVEMTMPSNSPTLGSAPQVAQAQLAAEALAKRINQQQDEQGRLRFKELPIPRGLDDAAVVTSSSGVSLRGTRAYDSARDEYRFRMDVLTVPE